MKLFDISILNLSIPSNTPPVSTPGTHTFAMAMFNPGTAELLSYVATTTLVIVEKEN